MQKVRVQNITEEFFVRYEKEQVFSIEGLEAYMNRYPAVFDSYFKTHCQRTPERLQQAIAKYPAGYEAMKRTAACLPGIIQSAYRDLAGLLGFQTDVKVNQIVGAYGSNAYVTHDGTVHFAIETLSDRPEHLRVLAVHELAHALHFAKLKEEGFDFSRFAWDGYTSLYLEGIAAFLSEAVYPGQPEHVYFSFDDTSEKWIRFFKENKRAIFTSLKEDLQDWSMDREREWFRLRSGKRYGYDRLGYLVGKELICSLAGQLGLEKIFTLWAKEDIRPYIDQWMDRETAV